MKATDSNATEVLKHDLYSDIQNIGTDSNADLPDDYLSSTNAGPSVAYSEMDIFNQEYVESVTAYNPVSLAEISSYSYVNALRLDCTVLGDDVTILLPPATIDSIYIDDAGRLWNMSTSNITGRIVEGDFNPYDTDIDIVTLTPCLGNNVSTIARYGSPNYIRNVRWTGNNTTQKDTYCEIVVNDYHYPFFASDMWNYITVFLLFVGVLLAWLSSYRRY